MFNIHHLNSNKDHNQTSIRLSNNDHNKKSFRFTARRFCVVAFFSLPVMCMCVQALYHADNTVSASEDEASAEQKATARSASLFDSNYLSGVLTDSVSVETTVASYLEIKLDTDSVLIDPSSNDVDEAGDSEAEEEEETTAEEAEETEEDLETEDDPRTSVWDKYENLGVVIAPNYLHIRTSPSMEGEIVGILYSMSGVDLLEISEDGEWYYIVSNGIEGYINAEFVATGDEARELAYEHTFLAVTVNAEVLNVRQEPSTESEILTQIIAGSIYEVIEETNDEWLKIVVGSDIEGYVSREFVTYGYALQDAVAYCVEPEEETETINPIRTQIVNDAMQYLGGAYVWGGTTLGVGVDCSGFMLSLFAQYGYSLPRTSYNQVNAGVEVSFEEMQPGDLIFYWDSSLGRIGHVALYIGNNLIIHAASEQRGIVIDDYRFMTPYCARNIIGE